jgi:hypothetical protein
MAEHPANCDCDLCFADECERVAEAYRAIRAGTPLATLPGWERAQAAIAGEMERDE